MGLCKVRPFLTPSALRPSPGPFIHPNHPESVLRRYDLSTPCIALPYHTSSYVPTSPTCSTSPYAPSQPANPQFSSTIDTTQSIGKSRSSSRAARSATSSRSTLSGSWSVSYYAMLSCS